MLVCSLKVSGVTVLDSMAVGSASSGGATCVGGVSSNPHLTHYNSSNSELPRPDYESQLGHRDEPAPATDSSFRYNPTSSCRNHAAMSSSTGNAVAPFQTDGSSSSSRSISWSNTPTTTTTGNSSKGSSTDYAIAAAACASSHSSNVVGSQTRSRTGACIYSREMRQRLT